ncbi:rod shape-determining MreC family protein [Neorickettsia helminthoeca str. Oregon]|uniref:Rod shape-determining MreC family protein n=1 Tax=Neorickettsia helminthoeca str. Oregon TaxID=1286528 RepID=X5HKR2_9RICK|nr:rod shape-determining protein MreC [Neorickettsia helminthoeca]AHX11649.1 rod shape-determining MreC family protein [Neorickettsia helminthoeca str. Oregon]
MYEYVRVKKSETFLRWIFRVVRRSTSNAFLFSLILCSTSLMVLDLRHAVVIQEVRRAISSIVAKFVEASLIFTKDIQRGSIPEAPEGMEVISKLLICQADNSELRKLLNFVDQYSQKFFSTRIVGNIREHTFMAIRGGNMNVKPDQLVVNEKGVIGKIISVENNLITGMLVTHPHFRIPVISAATQHRFIISGTGECKRLAVSYLEGSLIDGELVLSTIGGSENLPIARFDGETNKLEVLFNGQALNLVSVLLGDE